MMRSIGVQLLALIAAVVVIGSAATLGSIVRINLARDAFDSAVYQLASQSETDDDAHARLAAAQDPTFTNSATKVTALLTSCLGASSTGSTMSALVQLAGFNAVPAAKPDFLPALSTPTTEGGYEEATDALSALLVTDKDRTATTNALTESNLIAADEVARDLAAIAQTVDGASTTITAKYTYATSAVDASYKAAVQDVATETNALAPSLASTATVKITPAERASLTTSLTVFATACAEVAASSAAHKPAPVVHHASDSFGGFPFFWPSGQNSPTAFEVAFNVNSTYAAGCTGTSILAKGTTSGPKGGSKVINVAGSPNYFRILDTNLTETTVRWEIVACSKK